MKQISEGTHTDAILDYETREEATKATTTVEAAKMLKKHQNNTSASAAHFFVHFFAFSTRLPRENPSNDVLWRTMNFSFSY